MVSLFKSISTFINTRPVLFLLLITIIVYFNSLFNGYALDDELYALNPALSDLSWSEFTKIYTSGTFHDKGATGYDYRPVTLSSFFIEYLIFGKHVLISHTINLILYLIVLIGFYRILIRVGMNKETVLITMLLFALHPIHTEVICNLKCRDELLAFVFVVLSFQFAVNYFQNQKTVHLFFTFMCFLAAFLSKQTVVVFLIIIPVSLAINFGWNTRKIATVFLMLLLPAIIFVLIRKQVIPVNTRHFVYYENPFAAEKHFALKSSTGLAIALRYLKLLLVPNPLAYYYGYKYVDVSYFNDPAVIVSVIVHLLLALLLIKSIRNNKSIALGAFFYLINIFVCTFFLHRVPGLMGERFVFAASLGYCILLTLALQKIYSVLRSKSKDVFNPLIVLVLAGYALLSFNRSKVWKNKETLYSSDMKTLENSAKANLLYGSLLSEQALKERDKVKMEKAIYHLKRTTEIVPGYSLAWENLGVLYYFNGDLKNAFSCLNTAIIKDTLNAKVYFDKAVIFESMNNVTISEKYYLLSLKKDPSYIPAYLKFMNLLERRSQTNKAFAVGRIGATQEKSTDLIYSEMVRIALLQKDTLSVIDYSEKAAAINPENKTRIQTLENYFRAKGDPAKAEFYRKLLNDK